MITAEEAKKISETKQESYNEVQGQLNKLDEIIRKVASHEMRGLNSKGISLTINEGKPTVYTEMMWPGFNGLRDETVEELKKLGYSIDRIINKRAHQWIIIW